MRNQLRQASAALLFALAGTTACASAPCGGISVATLPGTGYAEGETVLAHDTFSIRSAALGELRPVNVYLPPQYRTAPPGTRFPVLYMPDGGVEEDFPHVTFTVDSLIRLGRIRPVLVVGIPNTQRRRDLTGPTAVASDSQIAPRVGGSEAFRRFVGTELIPQIERRYRVTGERSIVGESLAGLFVVETLLREPRLFNHYVAFDPSLWWNHGALVAEAPALLAARGNRPTPARTLYFAGSADGQVGGRELALALGRAGSPALLWSYQPHPELTHANIFRALAPAALAEALR